MDNRRLMLAILLSWAAVMVWSLAFGPKRQTPPPDSPAPVESPREEAPEEGRIATEAAQDPEEGEAAQEGASAPAAVAEATPAAEPIEAAGEEILEVSTERYVARFTNRGAQLLSFKVKGHEATGGGDVDLVRERTGRRYPFSLVGEGLEPAAVNDALFRVERKEDPGGRTVLEFAYRGEKGAVQKRFTFAPQGLFEFRVEAEMDDWGLFVGPGVENPSEQELRRPQFPRRVVYDAGDGREIVEAQSLKEERRLPGVMRWVALADPYFLAATLPARGVDAVEIHPFMIQPAMEEGLPATLSPLPETVRRTKEEGKLLREAALVFRAGGDEIEAAGYWGAKVYEELQKLPYGLERTVNFGWFTFLARPLHVGLQWIYANIVQNYGWAIVLMTVLIRLLMLPLTHTSMKSMQKMQQLKPKMDAIQAKYRPKLKDKQGRPNMEARKAMNDEVMALYRTEGVNPAGGCIPILLQFPVFLAFYGLLGGAIELRHAPWLLWIEDLSVADPYFVLPTVMGATQFIQQLRMPMGGDPMQRKLFLIMPVIFWFIFLKFPAGLVLYWLTNNVVGIVQQEVYKKIRGEGPATAAQSSKTKKARKPKKG